MGLGPKCEDVTERNAKTQQSNADTQQGAPAEVDTRHGPLVVCDKVERHTQQKGEQHRWRAVVFTQKARCESHGDSNADSPRRPRQRGQRVSYVRLQVLRITLGLSH